MYSGTCCALLTTLLHAVVILFIIADAWPPRRKTKLNQVYSSIGRRYCAVESTQHLVDTSWKLVDLVVGSYSARHISTQLAVNTVGGWTDYKMFVWTVGCAAVRASLLNRSLLFSDAVLSQAKLPPRASYYLHKCCTSFSCDSISPRGHSITCLQCLLFFIASMPGV